MEREPELTFHDTVPQPEEQLLKARETAVKQKEIILNLFTRCWYAKLTPHDVHFLVNIKRNILLTSVRRSITDLTKEGKLIKCQWSDGRMGAYGKYNRAWRYNTEYIEPLNPKK